eukprot:scaffold104827_cov63-Phaeocystis_antarctica.AAC.3
MSTAVVAAIAVAAVQKRLTTVVTVLPSAAAMVATRVGRRGRATFSPRSLHACTVTQRGAHAAGRPGDRVSQKCNGQV